MRVLITGGTGFIGAPLTHGALGRGWEVWVLTRRPDAPAAQALEAQGARLLGGDVTEAAALRAAVDRAAPDVLFHNAGRYAIGLPRREALAMQRVNVEGTARALAAAVAAGVHKVVYTSTAAVCGDTAGTLADEGFERRSPPTSRYEASKAEAHALARQAQRAGQPVVIVCPAQVVGPGDHSPFGWMARLYARRLLPPVGWAPESVFTFGHVDDVAEALLRAGEDGRPGETYFAAGEPLTVRETMALWAEAGRRGPPRLWLPRPLAMATAYAAHPLLHACGLPGFLSPEAVRSSYASFRFSSEKIARTLGVRFRPARQAWREALEDAPRVASMPNPSGGVTGS